MQEAILAAASDGDSVGGVLETAVVGMPEGVGEPWFDTIEGLLTPKGRHDPAIVHRARIVQDAATAIVLCDALALRYGTDWLG